MSNVGPQGFSSPDGSSRAMSQCPHGNHVGFTRAHEELRVACSVCGGPRVAANAPTAGSEVEPFREARRAFSRRRAWRLAAVFGAVVAGIDASIGALFAALIGVGFVSGAFFAMALPFSLLFFLGLVRSAAFSREFGERLAVAWQKAAHDVAVGAQRSITAAELAQTLGATEAEADRWLADMVAADVLKSEITDDAEVRYAPSQFGMRIDTQASPGAPAGAADANDAEAELEARFAELARREQHKS